MPDPYSQLLEWRRSEGSARGLAKLPKDFYESTRRYLAEIRATFEAELRENPSSRKGELARQTHQRAQLIARDLVEARMTKLLSQAFQAAVGTVRDVPNDLPEERALYESLVRELRGHRRVVAPYLETAAGPLPPSAAPGPEVRPTPEPRTAPAARGPASAAYVRIVKDGRPMAIGGETLEIRKEDVLSLSEETAQILVSAGLAERLKPSDPAPVT